MQTKLDKIIKDLERLKPTGDIILVEPFKEGNANDIYLVNKKYVLKLAKKHPKGIEVNDINIESAVLLRLKGKIKNVPQLIYRNPKLRYYLTNLISGKILKLFLKNMNSKEKQKLGKELGNFLYRFHNQKIKIKLQCCPDKNYHMKRAHQAKVIKNFMKKSKEIRILINKISKTIDNSLLRNKKLVLTHSDYHWKNIIIEPKSYKFNGLVDYGNVCFDHPEVDFRQMMGRYDILLGTAMVLEYEKLTGKKLDRDLLYAHCALNDLWHFYGRNNKNPDPWYRKWKNKKEYFMNF